MKIKVKKLNPEARLPVRSDDDVGFDLYSIEDVDCLPGQVTKIHTGIALADKINPVNDGTVWFSKIEGRSGLASQGVFPVGGIIDPGYRGELIVLLYNGKDKFTKPCVHTVKKGDKVAQMVIYSALGSTNDVRWECTETTKIVPSSRGSKGFGSTGV